MQEANLELKKAAVGEQEMKSECNSLRLALDAARLTVTNRDAECTRLQQSLHASRAELAELAAKHRCIPQQPSCLATLKQCRWRLCTCSWSRDALSAVLGRDRKTFAVFKILLPVCWSQQTAVPSAVSSATFNASQSWCLVGQAAGAQHGGRPAADGSCGPAQHPHRRPGSSACHAAGHTAGPIPEHPRARSAHSAGSGAHRSLSTARSILSTQPARTALPGAASWTGLKSLLWQAACLTALPLFNTPICRIFASVWFGRGRGRRHSPVIGRQVEFVMPWRGDRVRGHLD